VEAYGDGPNPSKYRIDRKRDAAALDVSSLEEIVTSADELGDT
jgi:hypothetical protein